jgi:hypothetical protein
MTSAADAVFHFMPAGHKFFMIAVAMFKRTLADGGLAPADELRFLQGMESVVDVHFTEEMVRLIEPASDLECKIVHEAMALDKGAKDDRMNASFKVLTDDRVFDRFVELNAGIFAALKWQEERSNVSADRATHNDGAPPLMADLSEIETPVIDPIVAAAMRDELGRRQSLNQDIDRLQSLKPGWVARRGTGEDR